jgi:transposase InsO family protein
MLVSFSGVGCCYDNTPMESSWETLKTELVYRAHYRTRAKAKFDPKFLLKAAS